MSIINETILYINLSRLNQNLSYLKTKLNKETEIIAVVKADAYGLGDIQIAKFLESKEISNFWVADFEEGVALRNGGIKGNIIVANPGMNSAKIMNSYNLEPVIYSARLLSLYLKENAHFNIHLKFNTGMNRYGFEKDEIDNIVELLKNNSYLHVRSICSHLSSSNNPKKDTTTFSQIKTFDLISQQLSLKLNIPIKRHILNSSGLLRFPNHQMDMVRLGLGLYGIEGEENLIQICELKTKIAQTRSVKKGDAIGYNNTFIADKAMRIGVIPIGYADGFNRKLGNSQGSVLINNQECRVLGQISMDSFIANITEVGAEEGDWATIFSPDFTVKKLATMIDTIPYEILATLNKRIKRIYKR